MEKTNQLSSKLTLYVTTSMLAALCCVATMVIRVPTIGTNGYVNIGDTIVLVSAWLLGPLFGGLAAGIGSGLADLLAGYPTYVPGTFIIKFAMAFVAALIYSGLHKRINKFVAYLISSIAAELIMVFGYFLYEATILGYGIAAAGSIISNIVQGVTCLVLGLILINALNGARNIPNYIKNRK